MQKCYCLFFRHQWLLNIANDSQLLMPCAGGRAAKRQALIIEELERLHEGVLARYGLRPSGFAAWKAIHRY
jgi:hypothetical protein